jgi:hypothetical protein
VGGADCLCQITDTRRGTLFHVRRDVARGMHERDGRVDFCFFVLVVEAEEGGGV